MTFPRRLVPCAALVGALAFAPIAGAAGPPLPSWVSGQAGAVAPGGTERFVARPAAGGTAVSVLDRRTGRVARSRRLPGRWAVPAGAARGGATGVLAGGPPPPRGPPGRRVPP